MLKNIFKMLALSVLLLAALSAYQFHKLDSYTMPTTAMGSSIPNGSLVFTKTVSASSVHPGQVLAYESCVPGYGFIIHRVISTQVTDYGTQITTKGDNNVKADPPCTLRPGATHVVVGHLVHGATVLNSAKALLSFAFAVLTLSLAPVVCGLLITLNLLVLLILLKRQPGSSTTTS